jgi:putative ABC transport system permease protein
MPVLPRFTSFFRTLTRGTRLDADLDDELRAYVDLLTDEKIRSGLAPDAARRASLLEVGGVEQVKEGVRDARVGRWLDTVWQDVRYATRTLRKTPGFTFVAVMSLAVGVGLNAAIMSAVQAVLLQDLPFHDPDRVVEVRGRDDGQSLFPPWDYLEWERLNGVFEHMGAHDFFNVDGILRSGTVSQRIGVMRVSASFFQVLGRPPALGRLFVPADDVPGSNVAILSDDWWRRQYRADPGIIGRTLTIDNATYQVIGVMPRGFAFYRQLTADTTDVWLSDPFAFNPRSNVVGTLSVIARLKPGVSPAQASGAITALGRAVRRHRFASFLASGGRDDFDRLHLQVTPLREVLAEPSRRRLAMCSAIAALVLTIAVFNLAALVLARTEARRDEFGLRAALGANRRRIVRQVLTECLLLAAGGGALGAALAGWSGAFLYLQLARANPEMVVPGAASMVRLGEARITWTIVLAITGLSMTAGLAVGAGSAWLGARAELRRGYGHGRRTTEGRIGARFRHVLVLAQLSISLVILSATALLFVTALKEQRVPLGFDPEHLLTMNVRYPRAAPYVTPLGVRSVAGVAGTTEQHPVYALTPYGIGLPDRLSEHLRRVPGVRAVGVAPMMPFRHSISVPFRVEGRTIPPSEAEGVWAVNCAATPGFFEAFGMKLLTGRGLQTSDRLGAPRVMVVNATLARDFLGGASHAIGRRIILNPSEGRFDTYDVVGVVSDVRFWTRHEAGPQMFTPYAQAVDPAYDDGVIARLDHWIVVRTADQGAATVAGITRAVEAADHGAPVEHVEFLSSVVARGSGNPQALLTLLALGAAVAVLLAAIGIFGTTAFTVNQQTHEIGVRVALGASPSAIMAHVMTAGGRLAFGGILVGSVGAYWTNQLLVEQLYGVTPTQPAVFIAAATLLSLVVLLATWMPARRAARVDPVVALRSE